MSINRRLKAGVNQFLKPLGHQLLGSRDLGTLEVHHRLAEHPVDLIEMIISLDRASGREPIFVQIGANDGVLNDPYREYILRHHLTGVLVEPLPDVYAKLVKNYAGNPTVRFANVAISSQPGSLKLYRLVDDKQAGSLSDFTTFDRRIAEKARTDCHLDARIEECEVPCTTLNALVEREQLGHLSLLFIDVEGYELEVLKSIDLEQLKPALIQFEHSNLRPATELECYDLLARHGYGFVRQKWETVAILATPR